MGAANARSISEKRRPSADSHRHAQPKRRSFPPLGTPVGDQGSQGSRGPPYLLCRLYRTPRSSRSASSKQLDAAVLCARRFSPHPQSGPMSPVRTRVSVLGGGRWPDGGRVALGDPAHASRTTYKQRNSNLSSMRYRTYKKQTTRESGAVLAAYATQLPGGDAAHPPLPRTSLGQRK